MESEREVNEVNGKLTEAVRDRRRDGQYRLPHHTPPFYHPRHKSRTLRPPEALRTPLGA
nr:MAG TPA: hypothetical protein [Caudoviricetes sp.]